MQCFGAPLSYPTLWISGLNGESSSEEGTWTYLSIGLIEIYSCILDEEEEKTDEEGEEVMEGAPAGNLQTASGLAMPSGMASVVLTVAAGLESWDISWALQDNKHPSLWQKQQVTTLLGASKEANEHAWA